jgi:hypothetical protein
MIIVSVGVDGDGDPAGDADGGVDGDAAGDPAADADGDGGIDGVSSDGPGATDGAVVGGSLGTCPRLPDEAHADATTSRPASAGTKER